MDNTTTTGTQAAVACQEHRSGNAVPPRPSRYC